MNINKKWALWVFFLGLHSLTWATEGGQIYFNSNSGNFGLGTETPQSFFHLKSPNPILTFQSTSAGSLADADSTDNGWAGILFQAPVIKNGNPINRWGWIYSAKNRNLCLWDYAKGAPIQIMSDGGTMYWLNTKIGINKALPDNELDVNGTIQAKNLLVDNGGILLLEANGFPNGVGINTDCAEGWARDFSFIRSQKNKVFVLGAAGSGDSLDYGYISGVQGKTTPWMTFQSSGFIGIGTTRPEMKLDIREGGMHIGYDPLDNNLGKLSFHHSHHTVGSQYYSGLVYSNTDGALQYFASRHVLYCSDSPGYDINFDNRHWDERLNRYVNKNMVKIVGSTGALSIGSEVPEIGYKLYVNGGAMVSGDSCVSGALRAKSITYISSSWADGVFEKKYALMPLDQVEMYIDKHGHLPNVPSQKKMLGSEQSVEKIQVMLLQKIEELTLYCIEQNKRIKVLEMKLGKRSISRRT